MNMKITVAGAGAGKTTSLAEKIISEHQNTSKIIYCISYTNASADEIYDRLLSYYKGEVPNNIIINTIDSFLYQEIISPYYYFLNDIHLSKIVNTEITNAKYKNLEFKNLREEGFLHIKDISATAKRVIKETNNNKKPIKEIKKNIKQIIAGYLGTIFIDEAQDIDEHVKDILLELDAYGIDILLYGDPKQSIRGFKDFKFLIGSSNPENITYISVNHRCPKVHVDFINALIDEKEHQTSENEIDGSLDVVFENDIESIENYITYFDLVYIHQKNDRFNTQKINEDDSFLFRKILLILSKYFALDINDTLLNQVSSKVTVDLLNGLHEGRPPSFLMSKLFKNIDLTKPEYAQIISLLKIKENNNVEKLTVNSIQSIKGLEANKCLFIVTPDLIPYFTLERNALKIKSILYVALTRSKNNLTLMFTREVTEKYTKNEIINILDGIIT